MCQFKNTACLKFFKESIKHSLKLPVETYNYTFPFILKVRKKHLSVNAMNYSLLINIVTRYICTWLCILALLCRNSFHALYFY